MVQGGLYNTLIRALQQFGLADAFGHSDIPLLVLNVTYPLVPGQLKDFCVGKRAVLLVEEGQPEYIEQELATLLRRADIQTPLHGKDMLPSAGEYTAEAMAGGLAAFVARYLPVAAGEALRSAQLVAALCDYPRNFFTEGTDKGETRAKPEIWKDAAKFKEAADKLQAESTKLSAAAKTGNLDSLKLSYRATANACNERTI